MNAAALDTSRLPAATRGVVAAGRHFLDANEAAGSVTPDLGEVARRHGMTFFVHRQANADLELLMRRQATAALAGAAQLASVTAALERSGVGAVALKGPALAAWLYGNVAAREFSDIDIAVARDDRFEALRVLEAIGYRLPNGMPARIAAVVYEAFGTWPLVHESYTRLDLHWRVGYPRFAAPLSGDELVAGRGTIEMAGARVPYLAPSHAATIALAHAAKHMWSHLEAVFAIAALARRPDVNWTEVRGHLERARGWTAGVAGLRLAAALFGVDSPLPLPATIAPRERRLLDAACTRLAAGRGDTYERWDERRAHLDALDTVGARFRYDLARLFSPTPAEWAWRPLPARLARSYYALRVARLVASGGRLPS